MATCLRKNKFPFAALVVLIIFIGLTWGNIPGPSAPTGIQVIDGVTYSFAEYPSVDHEMLAIFNYLNTLVSHEYQGYGEWDGWYADNYHGLHHYVLAFMAYSTALLLETTSGYRTSYYQEFLYDLIKKMNTTYDEWGEDSIEYKEWLHPDYNYVEYYYPNDPEDPNAIYTGGFRGPANIMWTGHYALMMSLYERSFNTGEMKDEISWFLNDWNNSLTTDGHGNPQAGGIWETGLIPCEPYIVFVQCNSVPITTTRLYDNMYGTTYFNDGMWDYGLDFINNIMQDQYDLFIDGYYVDRPTSIYYDQSRLPETPRGPSQSPHVEGMPKVSSYGIAWALAFLDYTQPEETQADYPKLKEYFMKEVSNDKAYFVDSYNNPTGFGTYDILGTLFAMHLANQMKDYSTLERLTNFFYGFFNKVWSPDGRYMYFDTMDLEPFLTPVASYGWLYGHSQYTIKDLTEARPSEFWEYPYISDADDASIWVYQAIWDEHKDAFILNIRVDNTATLTFSNFHSTPNAYANGISLGSLIPSGEGLYNLVLTPGIYQLVIK